MPIWLLPILQLLPTLIEAISKAVKSQPHVMEAMSDDEKALHEENIMCLDQACEQLKKMKV